MRFRLVMHDPRTNTGYDNEYLGSKDAIWHLWYILNGLGFKCEIFDLMGCKQAPEKGIHGLTDYQL